MLRYLGEELPDAYGTRLGKTYKESLRDGSAGQGCPNAAAHMDVHKLLLLICPRLRL